MREKSRSEVAVRQTRLRIGRPGDCQSSSSTTIGALTMWLTRKMLYPREILLKAIYGSAMQTGRNGALPLSTRPMLKTPYLHKDLIGLKPVFAYAYRKRQRFPDVDRRVCCSLHSPPALTGSYPGFPGIRSLGKHRPASHTLA